MRMLVAMRDTLPRSDLRDGFRRWRRSGNPTLKACVELPSSLSFGPDSQSSIHVSEGRSSTQQEDIRTSPSHVHVRSDSSRPPICKLSQDLVIAIADHLPLHSIVLLSSTCRTLRQALILHCDSTFAALTREERFAFLAGMKEDLPLKNVYSCSECDRLHPIDTKDSPRRTRHPHQCKPSAAVATTNIFAQNKPYLIYQRHIQLALDLWRTDPTSPHLASLLRPHVGWTMVDKFFVDSVACAQIIDGSFIMHTHRTMFARAKVPYWRTPRIDLTTHRPHFTICPHQKDLNDGSMVPGTQTTLLEYLFARLRHPGHHGSVSLVCAICGTDFELWLVKGKFLTIRTWHDFGTSGEPADPMWDAQVRRTPQDAVFKANKQGRGARAKFVEWQKRLPWWSKSSGSVVSMVRLGLMPSGRR